MHSLNALPNAGFGDELIGAYVPMQSPRMASIEMQPKSFFANDRTFLSWMQIALTVASVAVSLLSFSETADR
jgi:uncharacterized membrane protein YidH (DUF202 family)